MEQINFYLERFKNFKIKDQDLKEKIINIINEKVGVNVSLDEIKIINGVVKINKTGAEKSEIFINREKIESELNKKII